MWGIDIFLFNFVIIMLDEMTQLNKYNWKNLTIKRLVICKISFVSLFLWEFIDTDNL